jgi:hypothetical protein
VKPVTATELMSTKRTGAVMAITSFAVALMLSEAEMLRIRAATTIAALPHN